MPVAALLLPILAAVAQPPATADNPIFVTGRPSGPPFVSPMGEPFRARSDNDDTLADWFNQADRNRDGLLTPDEMAADADRFFAKLDTNHDGQIDPDELVQYEWEVAPEIQVNVKQKRPHNVAAPAVPPDRPRRGEPRDPYSEGLAGGLQGAARYALINMPEPVAAADADFNRAITREEFRQAALDRFQLLDSRHQGRLSLAELELLLPKIPASGVKPRKIDKHADRRIGQPLPPGN